MFSFRECLEPARKERIARGEFWLVDGDRWRDEDSRPIIRPSSAILADNYEKSVESDKSLLMMDGAHLSKEELKLVHETWEDHVNSSLPSIFELTEWRRAPESDSPSIPSLWTRSNDGAANLVTAFKPDRRKWVNTVMNGAQIADTLSQNSSVLRQYPRSQKPLKIYLFKVPQAKLIQWLPKR